MAASEYWSPRQANRTLRRRPNISPQAFLDLPERLREPGSDVEEDVTAPRDNRFKYDNQSLISLVARTGTASDYPSRFDEASSESESESREASDRSSGPSPSPKSRDVPQRHVSWKESDAIAAVEPERGRQRGGSRRKLSESKLLRSLPKLRLRRSKDSRAPTSPDAQGMTTSQILSPRPSADVDREYSPASPSLSPDNLPVLSRIIKAQEDMVPSPSDSDAQEKSGHTIRKTTEVGLDDLANKLKEVFDLEEAEKVVAEYPCWLLQDVLLQGYMYITQKHVCFYAYLPKKNDTLLTFQNVVAKSGYLTKRGKQNPRYTRYWFILKNDVLSYYTSENEKYFPSGNIDLRYAISATLLDSKEKPKEPTGFVIATPQRKYCFRADSSTSAKEWVKQLQRIIFRSHNEGDSVKISLPIGNITDLEESNVIGFANTVKLQVVDNDETWALDEYFFAFFSPAGEAVNLLNTMIDEVCTRPAKDNAKSLQMSTTAAGHTTQSPTNLAPDHRFSLQYRRTDSPARVESVRATLAPHPPTSRSNSAARATQSISARSSFDVGRRSFDVSRSRASLDVSRSRASLDVSRSRTSFDGGRRSFSHSRTRTGPTIAASAQAQTDMSGSVSNSGRHGEDASPVIQSIDETNVSASQILTRSDVFETPTMRHQLVRNDSEASKDAATSLQAPRRDTGALSSDGEPILEGQDSLDVEEEDSESHQPKGKSSASLRELVSAGSTYPLQKASDIAGAIKSLGVRPMNYYEKVSGMLAGGTRHYGKNEGVSLGNDAVEIESGQTAAEHEQNFRSHFALAEAENLQATYYGFLQRVIPLYGKIYVGTRHFCFRSLLPGTRTKLVLPFKDIEIVNQEKGFRFGYSGMVVVIKGHEELFFEFNQSEFRNDCTATLNRILESNTYMQHSDVLGEEEADAEAAKDEHLMLQEARGNIRLYQDPISPGSSGTTDGAPIDFDDPHVSIINFKPAEPLRITCLTIGSRGDVQPYIALCKGLAAEGHKPRIATHAEFGDWIGSHGIDFVPIDGDPAALMKICVDNGLFTYSFLKEATSKFRGWLDDLCASAWGACQGSDLIIESPSAMCGIHIAEALEVPYFRAFTMPWTRTRSYPHAFAVPNSKMGGAFNYLTYILFENLFWKCSAPQINRFRKSTLGLTATSLDKMQANKVPFMYNFSPSVVVPPLDFSEWVRVTGYWFLDEATDWKPNEKLASFIEKTRQDNKKLVYVGFGSITVEDRLSIIKSVIGAVRKADVRCIYATGWSSRGSSSGELNETSTEEINRLAGDEVFQIDSVPHDWLFKQVDAVVHHGGCGTTGASLRAGKPTIIKPFFGDQFFFAGRVEDLSVGIYLRKLNETLLSRALWEATHSERMIRHARVLGERIRAEDGVGVAIQAIYRDLEYARTLIKRRRAQAAEEAEKEESWTFIGDESDPEIQQFVAQYTAATTQAATTVEPVNVMAGASRDHAHQIES